MLVKGDEFFFPIDFVVLAMEEDRDAPLILRNPFLATRQILIDVKNGDLTLKIGREEVN